MMNYMLALLAALCLAPAKAQDEYGAKGIYPVYETSGQWVIFDKSPKKAKPKQASPLSPGSRFLVVGSKGSQLFPVPRSSAAFGGACRKRRPITLRTAILDGPRRAVGAPIIGIRVRPDFSLKGSRAKFIALKNEVNEDVYGRLGGAIKDATIRDVKSGAFRFRPDDSPGPMFLQDPNPDQIQVKIDFAARLQVRGLAEGFVLVAGSQVSSTFRRCLLLADGDKLVADGVEMQHALMAETGLLRFVAYDPGGQGNPLLLAYTPQAPLWGDERWGFALRGTGPRLFLADAMDPRCREGF